MRELPVTDWLGARLPVFAHADRAASAASALIRSTTSDTI
jgi:hypothetical protein